jgi:RNA polymerase sigma-70 factor (ECF subfamily)
MTRNIILNIFKHQQIEQDYQDEVVEKTFLYELTEKEEILDNVYYKEMLMIIQLTLEKCRDAKFGKCDKGSEDFGNI